MTQPTLVNLHANEYSHCYPFAVKLDRCVTPNDLSNTVRVSIKTEDLNLSIFNMITGINESKKLIKHISCKRKCRFDGKKVIQINGGVTINVDVNVKSVIYVEKIMFGNQLHVIGKMEMKLLRRMRARKLSQTTKLSRTTK